MATPRTTGEDGTLEAVRRAELDVAQGFFPPRADVLELGSGDGFQAAILEARGHRVTAVDLRDRPRSCVQHHAVMPYDGRRLPFRDGCFDVVFSSNVLEHVEGLPDLLSETRRVLRAKGVAVHVVPSATWRLWTSLAHYPYLLRRLLGGPAALPGVHEAPTLRGVARRRGWGHVLRRVLAAGPHGTGHSATRELWTFRRAAWRATLGRAGFDVEHAGGSGVHYTGYGLLPRLGCGTRRAVARILGSATHVLVARPC